jgi:hypothetical protein
MVERWSGSARDLVAHGQRELAEPEGGLDGGTDMLGAAPDQRGVAGGPFRGDDRGRVGRAGVAVGRDGPAGRVGCAEIRVRPTPGQAS